MEYATFVLVDGTLQIDVRAATNERRFMLLLACALAAMAVLGIVTNLRLEPNSADAAALPVATNDAPQAAPSPVSVRANEASHPQPVLQPLLAAPFDQRFPRLAQAVTSPPSPLQETLIVSYYGNPYSAAMGILGEADPETIVALLEERAAEYDRLNGPTGVVPALHLVYAVAQPHPAIDDRYLYYVDDAAVRRYIALAEERGMLLFLDLQIGRSSVEAEVRRVLPYLRYPQVHLALDPEFAVGPGQVPGEVIGSLRADEINRAQALLQELVEAERIPPKLLIVHQFVDSMVLGGEAIQPYPDVELIIDMDGFGPAPIKEAIYQRYASRPYASYAAIKLFFEQDTGLMSEEDVLSLEPRPAIVIYQ